ncbi:hypothetical protein [Noviherbaspirillum aerium]|uniref:hypothetical protein n=1 Tax=Noviherbaspirillum aerium TaxID=2588497 RepID=UPI00124F1B57|nr:hypothetical protein [Noviherbaspirillum aerium]
MSITSILERLAKGSMFFLVSVTVHAASSPASHDASALLAEIDATSAKQVIARLNAKPNPNDWDGVIRQIRSGQPAWLDVAAGLSRDADAGSATDLKISLAHALPKNPEGVLALTGSQEFLKVEEVCGAPFIEPTDRFLQHYLVRARQAVAHLHEPALEAVQAACLARLEHAERRLRALRRTDR